MPIAASVSTDIWSAPDLNGLNLAPLADLNRADVIVIGAGITGLATAACLVRAGRSCLVLEQGKLSDGASSVADGVAPHRFFAELSPAARIALSRDTARGMAVDPRLVMADLARYVTNAGSRICTATRALGFGRVSDVWVVSTERARVTGKALVVTTGAMVGAPTTFATVYRRSLEMASYWTLATDPLSDVLKARELLEVSDARAGIDTSGRLVTGGWRAKSAANAARLAEAWLDQQGWANAGFSVPVFTCAVQAEIAMSPTGAPQIGQIGVNAVLAASLPISANGPEQIADAILGRLNLQKFGRMASEPIRPTHYAAS